ncbi:unnamed protein product [Polarella glacialis]|uniref:Uncharacterized protein n=1 Tax=Polarella glacialis TaxID=89957 RepID=A0A813FGX5_POLGL|nr:unnamed protein product [Polarella glacialis]
MAFSLLFTLGLVFAGPAHAGGVLTHNNNTNNYNNNNKSNNNNNTDNNNNNKLSLHWAPFTFNAGTVCSVDAGICHSWLHMVLMATPSDGNVVQSLVGGGRFKIDETALQDGRSLTFERHLVIGACSRTNRSDCLYLGPSQKYDFGWESQTQMPLTDDGVPSLPDGLPKSFCLEPWMVAGALGVRGSVATLPLTCVDFRAPELV